MRFALLFLGVLVAVRGSGSAGLQQPAASRFVLANLTDTLGRAFVDVDVDDFEVREDGQSREVLSVRLADYPVAVVIDNDGESERDFDALRRATRRFLERIGRRPVAVATSASAQTIVTFSEDRQRAIERIEKLRKAKSAAEGLTQALVSVARLVQETGAPFSAIVVVATRIRGLPTAESLRPVFDSGATVHVVVQQKISGRVLTGQPAGEMLVSLVDQTHGQLTTIYDADSYQPALDRQANLMAGELMVEYLVPAGSTRTERTQLGVRLSGVKLNVWGVSR